MKRVRPVIALKEDAGSDVAVIGGGISGGAASYFLLRDPPKSVILAE